MYRLLISFLAIVFALESNTGRCNTPESKSEKNLFEYLAGNPEYVKTKAAMDIFRASKKLAPGIAAHRAANEFAPENTLSAIQIALNLEVDYIEIDVRQTKDGRSIILHDGNLDRTTNGKGPLKAVNFDEARKLSAGLWFNSFFADEKIPTLEESCQLLAAHNEKSGHKTYFYVDCKDINARILVDTLRHYKLLDNSVFYVSEQQIDQIRTLAPKAKMLPGLNSPKDLDRMIATWHPYALDTNWEDLSVGLIEKAHARGVKIFSDGFGEAETADHYSRAIQKGIDVISTNKISFICEAAAKIPK